MATSRRAATNENVSTYDSAGGKDYSVLDTWEQATDINLVTATQSEILEVYAGAHDDIERLDGATTDSSYFRIIRAASGEGHEGVPKTDGSVAAFVNTTDGPCLVTAEDYSGIQDLVIKQNINSSTPRNTHSCQSGANYAKHIGILVIDSINSGSSYCEGFYADATSNPSFAINCLSVNCEDHGFRGAVNSPGLYIYNCSSIDNGDVGFVRQSGVLTAANCLGDNNSTADYSGITDRTTCGSSDFTGSPALTGLTFTYLNSGSDDFRHASDCDGLAVGTDLSADGTFAFDDDIEDGVMGAGKAGETRVNWDLGFDEYYTLTTAAPTTVAPTTLAPTTYVPPSTPPPTTTKPPTTPSYTTFYPSTFPPPTTEWQTTEPPPTKAPTTVYPTTEPPTTAAPTTVPPPTTAQPTTSPPTSPAPTTAVPTTLAPTTLAPTTLAPSTVPSTTEAPTTSAPTTVAPTTLEPTTSAPTTVAATTVAPTTVYPTTLGPTTVPPTTLAPTTLLPTTEPPFICIHPEYSLIADEVEGESLITDESTEYSLIVSESTLNSIIC